MNEFSNKTSTTRQLMINDDPNRVLTFDPGDVLFTERFYAVVHDMEKKKDEYDRRMILLNKTGGVDSLGIPVNMPEILAMMRELCEYLRGQIDRLFGDGTSQMLFGDAMNLEVIGNFFRAIRPEIEAARTDKVDKYSGKKPGSRAMR